MTSQLDLIKIIEQNASTVDKDAEGFFNIDEFVKSDFIYKDEFKHEKSVILYSNRNTTTVRKYFPVGLNAE